MEAAKVALLLGQGFEDSEFRIPYDRLRSAGHTVDIIATKGGEELSGRFSISGAHYGGAFGAHGPHGSAG